MEDDDQRRSNYYDDNYGENGQLSPKKNSGDGQDQYTSESGTEIENNVPLNKQAQSNYRQGGS